MTIPVTTTPHEEDETMPTAVEDDVKRPASAVQAASAGEGSEPYVLETRDLGVRYDETHVALHDANLRFGAGTVTSLIGPSGCGKSTFLRCLNLMNLEIPHCHIDGEMLYHGVNMNVPSQDVFSLRKSIGMVFQQPNPFRKSIYDNIVLALRKHGVKDKKLLDSVVERTLHEVSLWDEVKDKLHGSAYALSGGQRQRLCIARTLAMEPDVVLMDEPCSALDPIATAAIEESIREMASRGICVIIVTHNIEQAARVSDQTSFFLLGEVVETGPTQKIFESPDDQRTADYLSGRFG
jgi:phosphate transport system ATP-binding protein